MNMYTLYIATLYFLDILITELAVPQKANLCTPSVVACYKHHRSLK